MSKRCRLQLQHCATEDAYCATHVEPLELFCDDDQVTMCNQCLLSQEHKHHTVLGIEAAAEKYRELFQEMLESLWQKVEVAESILADEQERMMMVREEEQNFKEIIESEYRMRFRLLREENEMNFLSPQGCKLDLSLTEANQNYLMRFAAELEENFQEMLQTADIVLPLFFNRSESLLLQCLVPARITDLSLCPIKRMSKMLAAYQRHITLDPETAHCWLVLSEDLRTVRFGSIQQDVPGNPRSFDFSASVLGVERFCSGRHYWEVAVDQAAQWQLGVSRDSADNKDNTLRASPDKFLLIGSMMGTDYTFWVFPPFKKVCLQKKMRKVGVFLGYEYGHISFYNVTERSLIYNFSHLSFQGALRPLFSLCIPNGNMNSDSLTVCLPRAPS
uniref:Tripartite motif family like 2 n=1 Tax=Cavia porcellus TaxID=10141 RepID=A0A286XVD1_CAVPO